MASLARAAQQPGGTNSTSAPANSGSLPREAQQRAPAQTHGISSQHSAQLTPRPAASQPSRKKRRQVCMPRHSSSPAFTNNHKPPPTHGSILNRHYSPRASPAEKRGDFARKPEIKLHDDT
ncbi:hypothetical protein B0T26DRAFT_262224 [Lasiosphaeria miniovina]|uniref:Uncharacterized protein n=1 Tax=Lasiosphaeria miniovina TaxID=1954250 RepID=A0AA40AWZ8_9PEZI|nr:uncharacterized protein B0T26DRAFT_262224 [Lasiosphaeria miniovina]KAK0723510.1 hypothetical protein B0T26DRAFT_262224 [Lasiosphaeria miniovina]